MKRKLRIYIVLIMGFVLATTAPFLAQAQDPAAPEAATDAPAFPQETIWLDDTLPAGAQTSGTWVWETVNEVKAHGHPSAKGSQSHGFKADAVMLPTNGMVTQTVWLDPKDPPRGIMIKFLLATGEEVGVYWEGEEEVFNPGENEETWYYGLLPELGKWNTLEVLAEDLGLEEEKVVGLSFATIDGHALWDKTVLTQAPPVEGLESFDLPAPETPAEAPAETE